MMKLGLLGVLICMISVFEIYNFTNYEITGIMDTQLIPFICVWDSNLKINEELLENILRLV